MYLETSGDILNIVLAFAIAWLTIILSLILWEVGSIAVGIRRMVRSVEKKLDAVDELVNVIRDRIVATSSSFGSFFEVARDGINWVRSREGRAAAASRRPKRRA